MDAYKAFHRMLAPIDPSILPKNRVRTWDAIEELKRDLSVKEQQDRASALDWVCNQMLEVAYLQLPQQVRDRAARDGFGYCIDGTPMALFARGKGVNNETASSDPDGGFYVREGDHRDPQDVANPDNPFRRTTTKIIWARELSLLTLADHTHSDRLYYPALPIAFTTDRPGVDPAGAARRLFANMLNRRHEPGWLAGDILYTNQDETKFQIPAVEAGYGLVLGYGVDQLGLQGAHGSGMLLNEGTYVAPCIPDDVVNATKDLKDKKITWAEYHQKIRIRVEYRMRNKESAKPGARGDIKERLACPAAGPNPTAICALKPKSEQPRPIKQPDGTVVDLRRRINHRKVLTKGQAPKVCQQETVTITAKDGAKFRQPLMFATAKQATLYKRLRNAQEGVHGTAKNEDAVNLDSPGRRRVRGWAAQQLFAAFLLAETSARRIATFLRNHEVDEHGHMYVRRTVSDVEDDPTFTPPGSAPPDFTLPVAA